MTVKWKKRFLAVYQTEFPRPTHTEEYKKVRIESDIFPGKKVVKVADFDVRVYKLIENFDPNNLGEGTLLLLLILLYPIYLYPPQRTTWYADKRMVCN
jgi:hypothetical protein